MQHTHWHKLCPWAALAAPWRQGDPLSPLCGALPAGEPWDWAEAASKAAGGALIVGGNYAYFEFRAARRAESDRPVVEVDVFEV